MEQLTGCGVPAELVEISDTCTIWDGDNFWSGVNRDLRLAALLM
ncbi:MAG: hypothetical protein GY780_15660 [bacterium]|nr:hypothetical protein [bacterium]